MKRLLALLLCLALLLSAGCSGQENTDDVQPTQSLSAEAVALAILDALELDPEELERTDQAVEAETLNAYLTGYYGLEQGAWEDCAIYRAGGAEALEIAVLCIADGGSSALEGLEAYRTAREGDFTGYSPEQAEIVAGSLTAAWGSYAALLICADAQAARTAFYACLGGSESQPAPSPEPSSVVSSEQPQTESPDPSEEQTPPPSDETEPSSTPDPEDVTPSEEPDPGETQSASPSEPVETPPVSPDPAQEGTTPPPEEPEPPEEDAGGPVTYPGRIDYVQPGLEDMSIYDTSAIRSAWENEDPSGLSDYDRAIYDKCTQVLEDILLEGMSDYSKELAVYQWLTDSVIYDPDHYDVLTAVDPASYTPYGPLINGKGVCLGFASTFQLLLDLCGVECIIVVGAAFQSSGDHAWNMVRLNGNWYCADATWDYGTHRSRWRYFNVTSDAMAQSNHQWDYSRVPEATAQDGGRTRAS